MLIQEKSKICFMMFSKLFS